jgi:hypothetical protein
MLVIHGWDVFFWNAKRGLIKPHSYTRSPYGQAKSMAQFLNQAVEINTRRGLPGAD